MKWLHLLLLLTIFSCVEADLQSKDEDLKQVQILLKEQKLDESIIEFLKFLTIQKKSDDSFPESAKFNEAYIIYLNLHGRPTIENAAAIIQKYEPTADDPNLSYILAASYANIGRFDKFYPLFLAGYVNNPDHYLADKMTAVLHIKLFERLLPGKQKEEERAKILSSLQIALSKKRSDHMLYKMILAFSPEADRPKNVATLLNAMIDEKVVYPRADLLFYVRMAIAVGNGPVAERFIDYSGTLFGYSRALEAARKMVNKNIIDDKE